MLIFLSQNNEYLQERLLQKGPTITERSKKVWHSLLIQWTLASWWFSATVCCLAQGVSQFHNLCVVIIINEFLLMHCAGAPCARLERPSPQDGGWWLGVERWWVGRGERGGQSCCSSSAGETLLQFSVWTADGAHELADSPSVSPVK